MTLKEFVDKQGSAELASRQIGVSAQSVVRWLKGKKPRSFLVARRLTELGVTL